MFLLSTWRYASLSPSLYSQRFYAAMSLLSYTCQMPMPIVPSLRAVWRYIIITVSLIIYNFSIDRMGIGGNGNSPHGNPMGMGISQQIWNGDGRNGNLTDGNGREWESHCRTSLVRGSIVFSTVWVWNVISRLHCKQKHCLLESNT